MLPPIPRPLWGGVLDFAAAKKHPKYPIGLVGTPQSIPKWTLPNPVVLGPSMYDNPAQNPTLMRDHRFQYYLLTCDWLKDVFSKVYGDSCVLWQAGISLEEWPDVRNDEKTIDVLIYDKIRWGREKTLRLFLEPVKLFLKRKELSYVVLPYGNHTHDEYRDLLRKSKTMAFLCEHETQGMAYQEALVSNVPIIAWDHGWWTDPVWPAYSSDPIPATSVPAFSSECGERYKMQSEFPAMFEKFWMNRDAYRPRLFVERELSFRKSAETYSRYYFSL